MLLTGHSRGRLVLLHVPAVMHTRAASTSRSKKSAVHGWRVSTSRKNKSAVHGWVCCDKPVDERSTASVDHARRTLKTKKVGHCGTLDSGAEGVCVCVSECKCVRALWLTCLLLHHETRCAPSRSWGVYKIHRCRHSRSPTDIHIHIHIVPHVTLLRTLQYLPTDKEYKATVRFGVASLSNDASEYVAAPTHLPASPPTPLIDLLLRCHPHRPLTEPNHMA